ncbi:hypothetical protein [Curtobacterium flaccumfaciens]|uniref:hypothetical protein n=1 Tax=Curtobacterium flaccumfaciens TaxID=2035 RepID=UPI001BDF5429|nr:hypothetical protein [Curtobacterium flaccumfaciens]MBT1606831.1 hypothetical protein [Curtobacterium flaccumfaciens pv. betae]MBT1657911.1 hypothetical protein [Curtobacterium flaccumfaciens pv. betae]MCS0471804.1 hypothetical protein [Curtobacterium flaccumfaciens pv. betae]MCS0475170.1 hypothetical protein [Curtobacterium flaccumfaciens pv. betae]MCS0478217.1 hypothetical protein [Curtobacterium flaccumfaciens pv. betae]
MTTIRPPRLDRTLTAVVFGPVIIGTGVTLASVAFLPGASVRVFVFILGAAFIAGGTWATARLRRVAVHLCDDTLRYSGFLSSWTAPRAGITAVLDDAFVEWRDDHGAEHRRQIWMLTRAWEDDGTKFAPLWRWRREALLEVRAWAAAREVRNVP